jgi:hypothetical protein
MVVRSLRDSPPLLLALVLVALAALWGARGILRGTRATGSLAVPEGLRPDLNLAPERHLVLLPGIGPARARAIAEERAHDPFRSLGDLTRVKGIGPVTTEAVAPFVRLPGATEGDP